MMVRSRSVFATGLLLSLMMCGGISQPMAQTLPAPVLRFGIGSVVSSADPHFHNIQQNKAFAAMVYDSLLEMSPAGRPVPMLALSWTAVGPNIWELRLRDDVVFHNGDRFTAEDVAAAFRHVGRVVNSPASFQTYLTSIAALEIVEPTVLRIHTSVPAPMLPVELTQVPITGRMNESATNADFNAGTAAIGTGPYRMQSFSVGLHSILVRNNRYWGRPPAWNSVQYRFIPDAAARTAALLAGDVDIIDQVSSSDLDRLRHTPAVNLSESDSLRVLFVSLDRSRTGQTPEITDLDGRPLERNPLDDIRVRRALSLAIDRDALVSSVMEGAATPTVQIMLPATYGFVADRPPPKADPDRARQLLAEAGFPNGFRMTLHGPNDVYANASRVVQAIGQMWTRVGVKTVVDVSPYASFISQASKQSFSAFFLGWNTTTAEPSVALQALLTTYDAKAGAGVINRGRYSNPAFDAAVAAAKAQPDNELREIMLRDATRLVIDDVAFLPLYFQKSLWAMRAGLSYSSRLDGLSLAQGVIPKP